MKEIYFLHGPLSILILFFLLGILFYRTYSKSNQGIGTENKSIYSKNEFITITILAFALSLAQVFYSYIGYISIGDISSEVVIDENKLYLFLGSIYLSLLLNISIFYGILIYIYKSTQNNFKKLLPFSILGFAMAESPSIIGLVILFDYISTIS